MNVDPDLVRAVQRGDAGAMDALIRETYQDVYRLCLRLLGDPTDAADATQEVYVRVLRSVLGFRGDATFGTWLHRVTINVCATLLRRRGDVRARGQAAGWTPFDPAAIETTALDDSPEDHVVRREVAHRVTRALADLSEDARQVVVLRDVQGLSTKQTATILGISEGAVKVRLHRAHARLRELVATTT